MAARMRKACENKKKFERDGPARTRPTANSAASVLALALVAGALQKFALLVLAHLLTALLDDVTQGLTS
jgi:hypothetical protein